MHDHLPVFTATRILFNETLRFRKLNATDERFAVLGVVAVADFSRVSDGSKQA